MLQLRPYQTSAVDAVRDHWRAGRKRILAVMATGAGKTVFFGHVSGQSSARGRRVLICAHRRELIRQASEKLRSADVPHGIIAPGYTPTRDLVQVGSIQTVRRRLSQIDAPDLIVADEAHHTTSPEWTELFEAFPNAYVLGVTATPERLDGLGLGTESGGVFQALVEGPQAGELIRDGYLTAARTFAPSHAVDLTGVRTAMGDYAAGQLAEAMTQAQVVGDAITHYSRLSPGAPAVLFSPSVRHAEVMAQAFRDAGWRGVAASGATDPRERDAAIAGLANGSTQVLCSCDLISEGLDVPVLSTVILMRPTKSLGLYMQQVGRGLRPIYAPGFDLSSASGRFSAIAASHKPSLIVLDHAGNSQRHGMVDTQRDWTLAGKKRKEGTTPTRQCPACFAVHSPSPTCPECEYSYKRAAAESPGRKLRSIDGDLQEVSMDRIDIIRTAPLKDLVQKARTESDLLEIARIRGLKPRWAMHVMIARRKAHSGYRSGAAAP